MDAKMKFSPERLAKMKAYVNLLPDPGPEVAIELIDEIYRLRLVLEEIIDPISFMEKRARETKHNLDYGIATQLSMSSRHLKDIAKAGL